MLAGLTGSNNTLTDRVVNYALSYSNSHIQIINVYKGLSDFCVGLSRSLYLICNQTYDLIISYLGLPWVRFIITNVRLIISHVRRSISYI